ncbi:MAG: F0F1 ATP synthase subunit A [Bacilli bacterium]|jgi:F-type H+-transporting ATPase subunit a|nr:F0F1 ATP synthase subunit A [Bacilli bacterium]
MNFDNLLNTDLRKMFPPEAITSFLVMAIIIVFSFVVYVKQKKYGPLDKPKGIVNITEMAIEAIDKQVDENMGVAYRGTGYFFAVLSAYIFLGFFIGMMGLPNFIYLGEDSLLNSSHLFAALPNPFTNLAFPLSIGLIMWVLTQLNYIHYSKWGYLLQFVEPIPIVGILTIWAPLVSISLRLFGNAFAGFCLSTIVYVAFSQMFNGFGLLLAPVVMPFFHAYFDIFSGFIQALVFVTLTMVNISQQGPDQDEQLAALSLKNQVQR